MKRIDPACDAVKAKRTGAPAEHIPRMWRKRCRICDVKVYAKKDFMITKWIMIKYEYLRMFVWCGRGGGDGLSVRRLVDKMYHFDFSNAA